MQKLNKILKGKNLSIGGVLLLVVSLFLQECGNSESNQIDFSNSETDCLIDYENISENDLYELDRRGKLDQFKTTDTTYQTRYNTVYKIKDLTAQSINDSITLIDGTTFYFDMEFKGELLGFEVNASESRIDSIFIDREVVIEKQVPIIKVVQSEYETIEKVDSFRTEDYALYYKAKFKGELVSFLHSVDTFKKPITRYDNSILFGSEIPFDVIDGKQDLTILADYEYRKGRIALSLGGTYQTRSERIGARARIGFNF